MTDDRGKILWPWVILACAMVMGVLILSHRIDELVTRTECLERAESHRNGAVPDCVPGFRG